MFSVAQGIIALACYGVAAALCFFSAKRTDMRFRWVPLLFSAFLFSLGTMSAVSGADYWWPLHPVPEPLQITAAVLAAFVGVATALVLWRVVPEALRLPSPAQLARANRELECEAATRQRTAETLRASEERYRHLSETLEGRVAERARELERTNEALQGEIEQRKRAQSELQQANGRLSESLRNLERHTSQLEQLGQMSDLLQTCTTVHESSAVAARYAASLFACPEGCVFLINPERSFAEAVFAWGEVPANEQEFAAEQCWAVRRGKLHPSGLQEDMPCPHMSEDSNHVCAPLIANGETLGVLQLRRREGLMDAHARAVLSTLAERTALAIANLRLREDLLAQSIHDPLTGLFNRRYMEETLRIEERRSRRSGRGFGVLMLDLDHFKELNDRHGHETGDRILREFSRVLLSQTRGGDVACRYGGEEFTVILPGATRETSAQRARQLRGAIATARFEIPGEASASITVSVGVAAFPDDGRDWEKVLQQADMALYRAKQGGRDRVEVR